MPSPDTACVRAPASKSISHRYCIGAALAHGTSELHHVLGSRDLECTRAILCAAGARMEALPGEEGGWRVTGMDGRPRGGTDTPLSCDVHESGTTCRLLTAVLAIVAIGLPAVYFGTFFANLSKQIKKLGLPRPFYRLELDAAGLSVWMAGEQNKTEPTNRYTWNTVYCAYRTKEAVYIYVQKNQAYLLNESMDAAWSLLSSVLPAASLHDCRK